MLLLAVDTATPQVTVALGDDGRLRGEVRLAEGRRHAEQLAPALTEAIRVKGDITVNMTALAFIDGSCARMIVDAARGLASSRTMVMHCHPGIAATFELLGAGDMAGVSLVGAHDR